MKKIIDKQTEASLSKTGWVFLPISLFIFVFDQTTKLLASWVFPLGEGLQISHFFNLFLVHNHGAAFSFLSNAGGWQRPFFITISSIVSFFVFFWLIRSNAKKQKLLCFALSFILGGAVGNLLDRVLYGYVIDFLDFYWQQYHWPVFNFADVGIFIGVCLLLLDNLKKNK